MIREITLHPEFTAPLGLRPSGTIRDLGPIVILTGANGAGKSRHLGLVADMLAAAPHAGSTAPADPHHAAFLRRLAEPGSILVDGPNGPVPPGPRDVGIDLTLRPRGLLRLAHRSVQEVTGRAARALFNAENARLARTPAVARAAQDAGRLNGLLEALLGLRIEPDLDERDGTVHAKLGDRRVDTRTMSGRQHTLLAWAIFLAQHAEKLPGAALFLDEAEHSLDPATATRLLAVLFRDDLLGERGQLWMTTVSPTVLLAAHPARVLLAEDGALRWSEPSSPQVLANLRESDPPGHISSTPALPVGPSDFRNIRREDTLVVDKTAFIADVLHNAAQVLLFTRPRRFGKTMNQSALRYFLERSDEDRRDLFQDLAVWRDEAARRHYQRYPVIDLTFKDVNARTWPACLESLAHKLAEAFQAHRGALTDGSLSPEDAAHFTAILEGRAPPAELKQALRFLTRVAARHGERVVILLDEYDSPIHSAYLNGYYDDAIDLFRGFLSAGLKDNPFLFKGVLTGVLRIAKESLFSGLNNVVSYSLLHPDFAECFGFTPAEVTALLRTPAERDRLPQLEAWYNGYRFGDAVLYNPWSIANYLNQRDREPRPFWTDTGDPGLLRRLLLDRGVGLRGDLRTLLDGGTIHKAIAEDLVLRDIEQRPDAVWSLLLFSGYLKPVSTPGLERRCALTIPNREVAYALEGLVHANLRDHLGGSDEVARLCQAILAGDVPTFEALLQRFLDNCMSSQSMASQTPEMAYEAFLLGLLVSLRPTHTVASQQYAGRGRADILITPRSPGQPGVVMELKTRTRQRSEQLDLEAALDQIDERRYAEKLREAGARPIHAYAAVFDGQRVWARTRAPDHPPA